MMKLYFKNMYHWNLASTYVPNTGYASTFCKTTEQDTETADWEASLQSDYLTFSRKKTKILKQTSLMQIAQDLRPLLRTFPGEKPVFFQKHSSKEAKNVSKQQKRIAYLAQNLLVSYARNWKEIITDMFKL